VGQREKEREMDERERERESIETSWEKGKLPLHELQ